ncbi:MAG: hypothetical protein NEHIOOID_00320 [Holosporales bacterium]
MNTQSALTILGLFVTLLNAAEQEASRTESALSLHQESIDHQTRLRKEEVIDHLTQGMDDYNKKSVIEVVENVSSDRYTGGFVDTIKQLTQGMNAKDKAYIIEAVGWASSDHYTGGFVNMVTQFTQGMNAKDKVLFIGKIGKVSPDRYTDAFFNTVTQLTQGMMRLCKGVVIEAVGKVSPDHYEQFIDMVNQLAQDSNKRLIIEALSNVSSDRYTHAFLKTVNQLMKEVSNSDKFRVIGAVGKVSPDHYERFIDTVDLLLQGMDVFDKVFAIVGLGNVPPDRYTHAFVNMINQLTQGMNHSDKANMIWIFRNIQYDHYTFLQNFIRLNPRYFRYVPMSAFEAGLTPNMTQQQLQELLQQLHRQYHHQAPPGTPQVLAFEVHAYANQEVADETGQKQPFNEAVLNHIQRSIQGRVLDYEIVLDLLHAELETLKNDPLTSDAINDDVYNWVIQSNQAQQDKNAIASIVTYLEQKDHTHKKLATWLYAFMEESKKAYDGRNTQSCMKGVKERVITSLRSAVPQGDAVLENLFHQAESTLMTATKSKKLTDYAFWAQKLQAEGVTSTTPQDVAKDKFKEALHDYFEGVTDESVTATIEATLDAFDDSESDSESDSGDASLRLTLDGLWSKIKAELIRLERGGVQPARAARPAPTQ